MPAVAPIIVTTSLISLHARRRSPKRRKLAVTSTTTVFVCAQGHPRRKAQQLLAKAIADHGSTTPHWRVRPEKAGINLIRDRLAVAASELLMQPTLWNVRECGACSWLFLDLSRSKSRRWCSMATCGNRVKARRHYEAGKASD
ncbi:CGNR zinc finger domain-containing protein [Caballeronia sp. GAFFF1]|uniref:CGNR zinc finger domain-containing protein n=1 Tax=Caballeronia sp. GAFFF1 TaxID=2921779 RepID=UPI0032EFC986